MRVRQLFKIPLKAFPFPFKNIHSSYKSKAREYIFIIKVQSTCDFSAKAEYY